MSETLILSQKDIRQLLPMKEAIQTIENAFKDFAVGKTQMIPRKYLIFKKHSGKTGFMPAYIDSLDASGVKIVSAHDENPKKYGLPRVTATMVLTDPKTGLPLAIMDATYTTMIRTGALGAIGAKHLARRDANIAGIIGTGVQGRGQLMGLIEVIDLEKVLVHDVIAEQNEKFAADMSRQYGIEILTENRVRDIVENVDILVTATNSKTPVIDDKWVKPGLHVTSIGVSVAGNQEIPTETLKRAKLVVDDFDQTSVLGGINMPVTAGLLKKADVFAEIGEILVGKKVGRASDEEITVLVASGLSIQDIAVARLVYEKAKKSGIGQTIQLLD